MIQNIKRLIFTLVILFIGVVAVNALDATTTDIAKWGSHIVNLTDNASNNCIPNMGESLVSTFVAADGSNYVCVITGVEVGDTYMVVAKADNDGTDSGLVPTGAITASVNVKDTTITLQDIVEVIYTGKTTEDFKNFILAQSLNTGNATEYVLKAGSSENVLYVYGGYKDGTMSSLKFVFDSGKQTLTYTNTLTGTNSAEYYFALYFTTYLRQYIMEASTGYDDAMKIYGDSSKRSVIESKLNSEYGGVTISQNPNSINVDLSTKGDINARIVTLYNESLNSGNEAEDPTEEEEEEPTNPGGSGTGNGGNTGDGHEEEEESDDGEDNPNTGSFVSVFAILSLISVGTVIVVGNRRKLFKI
jgi:hypothetical protein